MVKPAQVVEQQTSRIDGAVLDTTVHAVDFRVGGGWSFTMHGPDGTDYPNYVRYTLIERPNRIEYDHCVSPDDASPHFRARVTLVPEAGGTRVALRMELPSVAALEEVRRFGAVKGAEQTLSRLATMLETT